MSNPRKVNGHGKKTTRPNPLLSTKKFPVDLGANSMQSRLLICCAHGSINRDLAYERMTVSNAIMRVLTLDDPAGCLLCSQLSTLYERCLLLVGCYYF